MNYRFDTIFEILGIILKIFADPFHSKIFVVSTVGYQNKTLFHWKIGCKLPNSISKKFAILHYTVFTIK